MRFEDVAEEVSRLIQNIAAHNIEVFEGSATPLELGFLAEKVQEATLVREIGFNAGMSACAMLAANPNLELISYDLGQWDVARISEDYLCRRFSDRLQVIWGDTRQTLKRSLIPVDMTFVDGGHDRETALSDIRLTAPTSRFVMVDDIQIDSVADAVEDAIRLKYIEPLQTYADRDAQVPRSWLWAKGGAA